jgi:hypothetical protein
MTLPDNCYDLLADLPQFVIGKLAGNGNRTRIPVPGIKLYRQGKGEKPPEKVGFFMRTTSHPQ